MSSMINRTWKDPSTGEVRTSLVDSGAVVDVLSVDIDASAALSESHNETLTTLPPSADPQKSRNRLSRLVWSLSRRDCELGETE